MSRPGRHAVFLDRDGVINASIEEEGVGKPPRGVSDLRILPGVPEACRRLSEAGFLLFVVTNQPDVARGTLSMDAVEDVNRAVSERVQLDGIYVCPHDDPDGCQCRKPRPGMLVQAAAEHGLDLDSCFLVGDRWRDIDAGNAVGCTTILVKGDHHEGPLPQSNIVVEDLTTAAEWILAEVVERSEP